MLLEKAIKGFVTYMLNIDKAAQTVKGYRIELKLLNGYLSKKYNGPVFLDEIETEDLEDYLHEKKTKGHKPSSRNHSLYIIRSFYKFCVKKNYIIKDISRSLEPVPVPKKERVFLTGDEVKTLVSSIRPRMVKLIINTLFFTGLRISECLNLKLEDIDLKHSVILVKNTKNRTDRQIPIHKELKPLLTDYILNWRKGCNTRYFFTANNSYRVSPDYVNRVIRETSQKLGWSKKVTCHIIRHSFASSLVARNINIVSIQKLLGHNNLSTTSIYTHTDIRELENAINAI